MILSSDELEILEYLKSWEGKSVSMIEICRCAGGRKKFKECAHWAKPLMSRLVDHRLVEVNERGHYRFLPEEKLAKKPGAVNDNYFPPPPAKSEGVVGDNYFPVMTEEKPATEDKTGRWISPQMVDILNKSGKKFGHRKGD